MKKYKVSIEPEALADIQDITDWYNEIQDKLGKNSKLLQLNKINSLEKDPQIYAKRYKDIRCMQVKKFLYLVHFYIK